MLLNCQSSSLENAKFTVRPIELAEHLHGEMTVSGGQTTSDCNSEVLFLAVKIYETLNDNKFKKYQYFS